MLFIYWAVIFDEMMADAMELWWLLEYERVSRELRQ